MKKILFVVWDGPQVSYLEGLFYPIFKEICDRADIEFHIIQFTWGAEKKISSLKALSEANNFRYAYVTVARKPHPLIGAFFSIWRGSKFIRKYIESHNIDIVMPRSTMPAIMVNLISRKKRCKMLFDADGLPLEERVDFSGLKKSGLQYKMLKAGETSMLRKADAVIARSARAIESHLKNIGTEFNRKFFLVTNGRDPGFFKPDSLARFQRRTTLNISPEEKLFIYCGSLGPQYGLVEMLAVFEGYLLRKGKAKFLIITGSPEYLVNKIPRNIESKVIITSLPFAEVPQYMNLADVAFAIRKPTQSMRGVAPIKLGEYLLMDLPCIASKGIGDTEMILKSAPGCFLFDHEYAGSIDDAIEWAATVQTEPNKLRNFGIAKFSVEKSADDYLKAINYLNAI